MSEAGIRRRLDELPAKQVNYDPARIDLSHPPARWRTEALHQPLPGEAPGPPQARGSWEIAQRLIRGYEFADPSVVRAHYDESQPLEGRNMLLELRALGLARLYAGVRVVEVYDGDRELPSGAARVFGWTYRTLEGHVEMGQMSWEVWKWRDSGAVEFQVHAVSRPAPVSNPFIRVGFLLLRGHERRVFLESTCRRMLAFTELGLQNGDGAGAVRQAASELTARRSPRHDDSHERLARELEH
jgi:uncharacterized protein (UPF0548 family)